MSTKKLNTYTADFKARVALEALRGQLTVNEISSRYKMHATQIKRWKDQAMSGVKDSFNSRKKREEKKGYEVIDALYRRIG